MKNIFLAGSVFIVILLASCVPSQIRMEVAAVSEGDYDAFGIKNDGSLGKTGEGYWVGIWLISPASSNNTYQVGVQTDNGIIWSPLIDGIKKQVPNDKRYAHPGQYIANTEVIVPSEGFVSEIKAIQQERENWISQITKLEEQLEEIAYRNLTEARWTDYDRAKADVAKADKIQSQIDDLNDKRYRYYEPDLLVPRIKPRLRQITK